MINIKNTIMDILKDEYTDEIGELSPCKYLNISRIVDKAIGGLKDRGVVFKNVGIHPDFRSCSKCTVFHESPHHKQCEGCHNFSHFVPAEKVCSRCGGNISIVTKRVKL